MAFPGRVWSGHYPEEEFEETALMYRQSIDWPRLTKAASGIEADEYVHELSVDCRAYLAQLELNELARLLAYRRAIKAALYSDYTAPAPQRMAVRQAAQALSRLPTRGPETDLPTIPF